MTAGVEWYRGVPWSTWAAEAARAADALDPVTEVARGWIDGIRHDPSRADLWDYHTVVRGKWIAVISPELVVVGHGKAESGLSSASDILGGADTPGRGGRGPKTHEELIAWLADEGYEVRPEKSGHRGIYKDGVRLMGLASTPSDHRTLKNEVANCRRNLGIALRRQG